MYDCRHALPLFTSLLNVICSYDPIGYGVPYNHLMMSDTREPLVEVALQVLCVCLENDVETYTTDDDQEETVITLNYICLYGRQIHLITNDTLNLCLQKVFCCLKRWTLIMYIMVA